MSPVDPRPSEQISFHIDYLMLGEKVFRSIILLQLTNYYVTLCVYFILDLF